MTTATRPKLAVAHRDVTGKAVAKMRRDGRLPAVVYGHGVPSESVSVDAHEFDQLRRHAGPNTLIDLSIDGKKPKPVLVHGVQIHPVNRRPLHVDLYLVRMTEELIVDVPLVPTGVSEAVSVHSGTLLVVTERVRVKALPDHLPQAIEFSIESLADFEAQIHVRDLAIPGDVTLLTDVDEIVAKVLPPRVEEEPVVAAEELEGEEVPEGEEAVAAAGEAAEGEAPSRETESGADEEG